MKKNIVCVGECMMELRPEKDSRSFVKGFAGDTFNTAWYARKLLPAGWSVDYLTAIGDDTASKEFIEFAKAAKIGSKQITVIPDKSLGLYMVHLDNGERSFSYWRDTSAARLLADDPTILNSAFAEAGVIYFSGITVAILTPMGRRNLFAAIKAAKEHGAVVAFDTNLRPRLWESNEDMASQVSHFATLADIVLPSFDDEVAHFLDKNPIETAERYKDLGASVVVVKSGAAEIFVFSNKERFVVPLNKVVSPVDTTAAGDSFNAGYLATYLVGSDVKTAVTAGAEIAAKVVAGSGALVNELPPENWALT